MENIFVQIAETQGIWTALSLALIFYIVKKQEKRDVRQDVREEKYQEIILDLTEKLSILSDLKADIHDIKQLFNHE